ncbi:MAG: heavy-metal-associated domain-containing protein [Muribaculaceae bacterium]|nr:heavy-metal-associated domain-containing protein [Muribaculaceae bacterium]
MKKFMTIMMAMMFAFSIYAKDIQELVVTTNPPMSCQNCENKIKGNLRFEKGVKKIETNLKDQRVTIEYDAEKTTPQQIENAFQKIGYKVEVIDENTNSPASSETAVKTCCGGCCKGKAADK